MRAGIQNLDMFGPCDQTSHELHLIRTLTGIASQRITGYLRIADAANDWMFYLEHGKLVYASNSLDPFGRLDRHLRCLYARIPRLTCSVRVQIRLLFENQTRADISCCGDYAAICWLVELEYLTSSQAAELIAALAKEVFETLLLLQPTDYGLLTANPLPRLPRFCGLDLHPVLASVQEQSTHMLMPSATEVQSVQKAGGRSPQSVAPLSRFSRRRWQPPVTAANRHLPISPKQRLRPHDLQPKTGYTVACIDDSPTILSAIERFLKNTDCSVLRIEDPVSALMCIIRTKPDLVLLDITMPNLDGYELCSLLRRNKRFKKTPIIIVSSHTEFIDRAKAKLVGASSYLTKPFTRSELLNAIEQHLR